jgi:hypothetical protein
VAKVRIRVDGTCESATSLRSLLKKAGYALGNHGLPGTLYTIKIEEAALPQPIVDGVDSDLERHIVNHIAELSPSGRVLIQRQGGIQSQFAIRIVVPSRDDEREKVELGILRGLAKAVPPGKPAPPPRIATAAMRVLMVLGIR